MIKIPFGEDSGKMETPEMETKEHGMPKEEHDVHMEAMKAGLQQILASEDINEIKSIAQGLLGEEQKEQGAEQAESMGSKESLDDGVDKILAK